MAPKKKASAKGKKADAKQKERWEKEAVRLKKQALREHPKLRTLNDTQVHGTVISGLSLYDAIRTDKYNHLAGRPGAPSFGSVYYGAMAAKYMGKCTAGSSSSGMVAAEAALSEELVEAVCGWEDTPKRPAGIFELLSISDKDMYPSFFFGFCFFVCA